MVRLPYDIGFYVFSSGQSHAEWDDFEFNKLDEYELWSNFENTSRLVNGAFTSVNGEQEQMKDITPLCNCTLLRKGMQPARERCKFNIFGTNATD